MMTCRFNSTQRRKSYEQSRNKTRIFIKKFRTIRRKELKAGITEIDKENAELFRLWVWDKALDVAFLKQKARQNLITKEDLTKAYEAVATVTPTETEVYNYLKRKGEIY